MNRCLNIRALRKLMPLGVALGLIPLAISCASDARRATLQPVRNFPANSDGSHLRTHGFLVVYTPTELHFDDKLTRFYPHTGYSIYEPKANQLIKYVPNRTGKFGEAPNWVLLPAGSYTIQSRTAYNHPISIPIIIRPETTTTINLEGERKPPASVAGEAYHIRVRGNPVGWATDTPGSWPDK